MLQSMEWERPSERVRELFRRGAELVVAAPQEWLEELDEATLSGPDMQVVADDPALAAALRRANRANLLYWATANARDPGAPVPANLGPEPLSIGRDLVRRGLNESALKAYRIGQNVAWQRWMAIVFELTSDPRDLQELLEVSAQSIFAFIEATIAGVAAQMQIERDELVRGTHAERREVVELILAGAPITAAHAAGRLGYDLAQTHTAAVIWSDEPEFDASQLDRVTETLARLMDAGRPLSVIASAATRWSWIPGRVVPEPDAMIKALNDIDGVRVAMGSTGHGVEGFRRSHLDAITTQRMLARLKSPQRIATFEAVALVSLVAEDPERAEVFINDTLGDFVAAKPELRRSVLTFVREQCNASRAAARLYTHRNTLLRHLARADEMLPRPLATNSVHVAVALEVLHWRGSS